ncbi:HisA/HisF-related TIM barrel protein [Methylocapsa palsarum]|uniref:Phosphoribosylformimino-5-aminoimidazole carboxamide ribotide isomerase n=1 Tax=Methylocapsa palsarum TaxID=1612308 RepID=A0A1I3VTE7_9HYPH|nr:HisA/HisF-related TIM barrel protein [Methylocapsa palsarum]SFJ98430.1 phosphoribosylformimino-5-aminoimidazole carboxamide ribotide isomerase [Methylocapsa palsarum]
MEVIPVIDLKGGAVVAARRGLRDAYAPIATRLAQTSDPFDVAAGFLTIFPFRTIYVADLDAIAARGGHEDILVALSAALPDVTFWVDSGIGDARRAVAWLARHPRARLVLGSESLKSMDCLDQIAGDERVILSLDTHRGALLGPPGILEAVHFWPARVIAMSLDRVGAGEGPDLKRLVGIAARSPSTKLYAAGGVRGLKDLKNLMKAGMAGALVASALHDGRLTGAELASLVDTTPVTHE